MDKHKKMSTQRHSNWSITINNPTPADEEDIARARQKGWKVDGQLEKGENGTPHYQLMVSSGQVRFSAVKKAFPRAHIEPARNPTALKQYVHKDDTKVGELATSSDKYPSLSKFWLMVADYCFSYEKDRLDMYEWEDHKRMVLYRTQKPPTEEQWLELFRDAISHYICRGFHVESFYSPPNISVFKNFARSILLRSLDELSLQTARQPDVRSESEESIPNINIPTTDADDDEEEFSEETDKSSQASP